MREADDAPLILQSRVPPDARGQTLLAFLSRRFRYHDAKTWQRALDDGRLALDGRTARGDELLRPGMRLRYEKAHQEPAVDTGFAVLHRDDALVVVDKPAHLPVHADGPFVRHTLIHLLRSRLGLRDLHLVHRLDRETSGVCLVAVGKTAQALVQAQFTAGAVAKRYLAIAHGVVRDAFVVDRPIGHAAHSAVKLRRSAAPDARAPRPATTRFVPLAHGRDRTLLRCEPTTGRTHQIRVHLEHAGHPVVGDKLYGQPDEHYLAFVRRVKAGASVFAAEGDGPNRQLLHAERLELLHPDTGDRVVYEAPAPAAFERWLTGTSG